MRPGFFFAIKKGRLSCWGCGMSFDLDAMSKLATIIGSVVTVLGVVFGAVLVMRLSLQSTSAKAHAAEATAKDAKLIALAAEKGVHQVAADLASFRETAAREFVSVEALGRFEGRIEEIGREMRAGLDDLRNKLIEFFTRPASRPRSGG